LFAKLEEGLLFHKTVHKSPRGSSVSTLSVKKKKKEPIREQMGRSHACPAVSESKIVFMPFYGVGSSAQGGEK